MKNLTIGERIRNRRKEMKFTQRSLAKALKISHVSVSQWERDDSEPTGKNLFALTKILQCTPTWVLFGDQNQSPQEPTDTPLELDDKQRELIGLFIAITDSEQDELLNELRARVENNKIRLEELLKARQRASKK
ncbi:helix-turn-helix domain-containing protein [Erwinia pyrifoliae]|uniref:Helix-turn-helix domain-containing protein n=1 Tax=Erwinia pyrifoliae TaxID=79967 RepID=A0ABY5XCC0_ERWPY|nr:helix-turn-helix domain-containing protein [Erwinia pyrifoliae]AUX72768.1 transcriptional regulator [Erwinia pyrifoliae]MCA8876969.1 helix-turn-helix domain-containing protein [Erwinia pyrifoliae]MCT2387122.1 helix-turn-helix domain-containing protein [Erwinia pyrifoliae]MCU8587278.1 helix-turn-helix domain-containing protein [Erwinia pyrifoliae]UWS31136.1 helix-turn-helix domain-containing protein [Erwinia pyrifoliae]